LQSAKTPAAKPGSALVSSYISDPASHYLPTDTCKTDPDLAALVDAWPALPEAVRAGIVAMVKATVAKPE